MPRTNATVHATASVCTDPRRPVARGASEPAMLARLERTAAAGSDMEDPFENGPRATQRPQVVVDELARIPMTVDQWTQQTYQPGELYAVPWYLVGRPTAHDHERVADAACQRPGGRQRIGVRPLQQPGVARGLERDERPRRSKALYLMGVAQLQQLDRPLDVGERAATELCVHGRVGATRQALGVHPRL